MDSDEMIRKLRLEPHPEGGFYSETYKSEATMKTPGGGDRHVCTVIYYLLRGEDKSVFHRLGSDECWFFHLGQALEIVRISDGKPETILLGNHIEEGETPQAIIQANTWFAAR